MTSATVVSFILNEIQKLPGGLVYALVGLLVFGEAALFIGFVLPGETSVIVAGVVASQGHVNIVVLCVLVVLAAVVGDSVGYAVGSRYGQHLLKVPIIARRRAEVERTLEGLHRRGRTGVGRELHAARLLRGRRTDPHRALRQLAWHRPARRGDRHVGRPAPAPAPARGAPARGRRLSPARRVAPRPRRATRPHDARPVRRSTRSGPRRAPAIARGPRSRDATGRAAPPTPSTTRRPRGAPGGPRRADPPRRRRRAPR